jgi:copper oxidase (laccase) domain-containing protein
MTAPTAVYHPFSGRVEIRLYGKPNNWSLLNPPPETLRRIGNLASAEGVYRLLAPKPSAFNARVCLSDDLTETVMGNESVSIHRGVDADGAVIPPGQAFYLASADCLTVVTLDPKSGMTVAAHAGRDCLFDRKRINGEGKSREHESVVDAIVARYEQANIQAKYLKVFMTCGISPKEFVHDFQDPKFGTANMKMCADVAHKWGLRCLDGDMTKGKLVLTEIVRAQFMKHGVDPYHIGFDIVDTYGDTDRYGNHLWWSHRREPGPGRNAVLVTRKY